MSSLFNAVTGLLDNLFGGPDIPTPPPPPAVEPPPTMPDEEEVKKARRRSIAGQMARRGRQSTILSQNDDAVGGAIADADKLGA